jgi:hypothetical protein
MIAKDRVVAVFYPLLPAAAKAFREFDLFESVGASAEITLVA